MSVDAHTFGEFAELEIIAHCLYEMTFIAFDQEEIKEQLDDLNRTLDEYKNMTPEVRKNNTTSLEDFLKGLDSEAENNPNDLKE